MLIRKIISVSSFLLIVFGFIWLIKTDIKITTSELGNDWRPTKLNYHLRLNYFDYDTHSVNATLSLRDIYNATDSRYYFAPLEYKDLSTAFKYFGVPYAVYSTKVLSFFGLGNDTREYFNRIPESISINIEALSTPGIYPFDKYLIIGAVKCHAYKLVGDKRVYLRNKEGVEGEHLSVSNAMLKLITRIPNNDEMEQFMLPVPQDVPQEEKAEMMKLLEESRAIFKHWGEDINNFQDSFALILERPLYLKYMTIIFGLCALITAFYIGLKSPYDKIPLHIMGFIISLWGLREILIVDKAPTVYMDYAVLLIVGILIAGLCARMIWGRRK